jgi:hypothetical protein
MNRIAVLILSLIAVSVPVRALGQDVSLKSIHKIFIEKMPNDLDQYISSEITKQMKGRMLVVLDKADADGILKGTGTNKDGVGAAITGRYKK